MNRFTQIVDSVSSLKTTWDDIFLRGLELWPGEEVLRSPYTKSSFAHTCIATTARAISQVPIRELNRRMEKGKEIWEPAPSDSIWQLLFDRPNYMTDGYSFIESIVGRLFLDGNVFIVAIPPGSPVPAALWAVPLMNMEPITDNRSGLLIGWTYRTHTGSGPPIKFDVTEVAHIKFWNPDDPILGMSPFVAGKLPLLGDFKAANYNNKFFDEGAVPGGILTSEKRLDGEARKRLREQFESRHRGYKKAFRTAVLEGGVSFKPISSTHAEMEFLDLRKFSRDEIAQVTGMKKAVVSVTEDLNYATHKGEHREWWTSTNLPIMQKIISPINFAFFGGDPNKKAGWDLQNVGALQDEYKDKVEMAAALNKIGFTANELNQRLNLGFDNRKFRDYWYVNIGLVPVSDAQPMPANPYVEQNASRLIDTGGQLLLPQAQNLILPPGSVTVIRDLTEEQKDAFWRSIVTAVGPIETMMAMLIKNIFYQMRKRTLDLLYRNESAQQLIDPGKSVGEEKAGSYFTKTVEDILAEDYLPEKDLLQNYSIPIYEKAIIAGIRSIESELGIDIAFNLQDPLAIEFMGIKPVLVRDVIDTVREYVRAEVTEGIRNGESIDQIASRLTEKFKYAASRRTVIARTETMGAANFSRYASIVKSGFQKKQWWTALDERVRDKPSGGHKIMHMKVVSVDEVWTFGDLTTVKYPTDYNGSAKQVIQCRCIEVVVVEA